MEIPNEISEDQRKRAETNRIAALAKRKASASLSTGITTNASISIDASTTHSPTRDPWKLFKCRKVSSNLPLKDRPALPSVGTFSKSSAPSTGAFTAWLEICSPDSFSIRPIAVKGFVYPGDADCLRKLNDCLSEVVLSHFTQNSGGGKACVYKLRDYDMIVKCLRNYNSIEIEEIPWGTLNVVERFSHSFTMGKWIPCRPEHLSDDKVDELMEKLPRSLLDTLRPFQIDGVRFGLRRGGRCLIADEMGLGKTLQAIAIAGCFMNEGSILVVCPAILRFTWAEELERWLFLPSDIHLVFGHQNNPAKLAQNPRVVVISYTMLHHLRKSILKQEWSLLVVDESHHVRCSKKAAESEEIKAVLNLATKVKHIVLLSGTPSLSRPFDIFHQIDMLWPGLLGRTKYEFAKVYCALSFVQGPMGNIYQVYDKVVQQDFSKGVRLEELNVLLKQTVMIRRLKEHVLLQLPPKRRQIVMLLLKRSDVVSARTAVSMDNCNGSCRHFIDLKSSANTDESAESCNCHICSEQANQILSIAKLYGFLEWLSIHPIMSSCGGDSFLDSSINSHKMIIFAHHLKVLDGVQEFVTEKGIGFVRIDGKTLPKDRHSYLLSFKTSIEVKIAIIGLLVGAVGVDFSAAQHVVFLELPPNPAIMQQAEDRAHRHGQEKTVNIYIFCAKDTSDESHWRRLNKSLHRVSSTTNGKYDTLDGIAVEHVSYLERCHKDDKKSELDIEDAANCESSYKRMFSTSGVVEDALIVEESDKTDLMENDIKADSELPDLKDKNNDEPFQQFEFDKTDQAYYLRFEVSQYTGRIHLFSCIPGTDSRPRPLFVNYRPEDLESIDSLATVIEKSSFKFLEENPSYRTALLAFLSEWNNLRPVEQKKLLRKPLQLPLTVELCCLEENINHNSRGLLKGGSKQRSTPKSDISHPLPPNAAWRKVRLCVNYGKKEKIYTQGWTALEEPLCKFCQTPCKASNAKSPEFFEDLFCNLGCYEEFRLRTSTMFLRRELFHIEHGVCTNCQLDCHKLVEHMKPLSEARRQKYIEKAAPNIASRKKLLEKLISEPTEGNAWHADHIVPVYRGGGECRLENMRTLCVACHFDVTAAQRVERRSTRAKAKKELKTLMSGLQNGQETENIEGNDGANVKEHKDTKDGLLVKVPGSAYSTTSPVLK